MHQVQLETLREKVEQMLHREHHRIVQVPKVLKSKNQIGCGLPIFTSFNYEETEKTTL